MWNRNDLLYESNPCRKEWTIEEEKEEVCDDVTCVCMSVCHGWWAKRTSQGFPLGRVEMKSNFVECIHMNLFNELVSRIQSCFPSQRWCVTVCVWFDPIFHIFSGRFSFFWFWIYFDKFSDCSILMAWKMRKTSKFRNICLFLSLFVGRVFFSHFDETNINSFSNTCRLTNLRFLLLSPPIRIRCFPFVSEELWIWKIDCWRLHKSTASKSYQEHS